MTSMEKVMAKAIELVAAVPEGSRESDSSAYSLAARIDLFRLELNYPEIDHSFEG